MREKCNLGARRLQTELIRLHQIQLSTATLHKVLSEASVKPIVTYQRKNDFQRYERPIPGDRVQMNTCKIAPRIYQYTAIDDCSRYRVLRCYSRRTTANTVDFIDCVVEEMPFLSSVFRRTEGVNSLPRKFRSNSWLMGLSFVQISLAHLTWMVKWNARRKQIKVSPIRP